MFLHWLIFSSCVVSAMAAAAKQLYTRSSCKAATLKLGSMHSAAAKQLCMVNRSMHTCTHEAAAKQLTLSRDRSHLQLELLQL